MSSNNSEPSKRWEGYSDYQTVSSSMARSIDRAIDAYAALESLHAEGARVRPDRAAEARRYILAAAMKLVPELEANKEDSDDEIYEKIVNRWQGSGDGEGEPYFERLRNTRLQDDCPDWLEAFVTDIRLAGWEIGYLQAGKTVQDNGLHHDEEEARSMFE